MNDSDKTNESNNNCNLRKYQQQQVHLVAKLAGQAAKKRLLHIHQSSQLLLHKQQQQHQQSPPQPILQLSWDDIFVEDMLGMGSFASVCLVTCPKLRRKQQQQQQQSQSNSNTHNNKSQMHLQEHSFSIMSSSMQNSEMDHYSYEDDSTTDMMSGSGGSMMMSYASTAASSDGDLSTSTTMMMDPMKYYACKSLSNKTIQQTNVRGFIAAAADLVHEAFLLSHISSHPNIVRLYGIPKNGGDVDNVDQVFTLAAEEDDNENDLGYFLLMEALTGGILNDKLSEWRQYKKIRMMEAVHRKQQQQQTNTNSNQDNSLSSFFGSQHQQEQEHSNKILHHRAHTHTHTQRSSSISTLSHNQNQRQSHQHNTNNNNNKSCSLPTIVERLDIALQIANGMQHLHSHHIIFRDLKPHNVGLSSRPSTSTSTSNSNSDSKFTWRIFDFGLAREVIPSSLPGSDVVNGKAGSYRYMAPETMGGQWLRRSTTSAATTSGSNNSSKAAVDVGCFSTYGSDVYGFAILLWELIGLEDFDHQYDSNPIQFECAVCDHNHRPNINDIDINDVTVGMEVVPTNRRRRSSSSSSSDVGVGVSELLRNLIQLCWNEDYKKRPSFEFIIIRIQELIISLSPSSSSSSSLSSIRKQKIDSSNGDGTRICERKGVTAMVRRINNRTTSAGRRNSLRRSSNESISMKCNQSNRSMMLDDLLEHNVHNGHDDDDDDADGDSDSNVPHHVAQNHDDNVDDNDNDDDIDDNNSNNNNNDSNDDDDDDDFEEQSLSMNGSLFSLMNESFMTMGMGSSSHQHNYNHDASMSSSTTTNRNNKRRTNIAPTRTTTTGSGVSATNKEDHESMLLLEYDDGCGGGGGSLSSDITTSMASGGGGLGLGLGDGDEGRPRYHNNNSNNNNTHVSATVTTTRSVASASSLSNFSFSSATTRTSNVSISKSGEMIGSTTGSRTELGRTNNNNKNTNTNEKCDSSLKNYLTANRSRTELGTTNNNNKNTNTNEKCDSSLNNYLTANNNKAKTTNQKITNHRRFSK